MNYYERHLGDYARDTAHLSLLEHGVYTLLLDRYYATEQPIPGDQAHRLARARTEDERAAVDVVLDEFFQREESDENPAGYVWVNRRVEEELEKAHKRINTARENGKKGGRPPKQPKKNPQRTHEEPGGFSTGSENETQTKAHQAPDTSKNPPKPPKGGSSRKRKITLREYLDRCEAEGAEPIPPADGVWKYPETMGFPADWIPLAWWAFQGRYLADDGEASRKYLSWPQAFRNAVRENWLRLWWADGEGYRLTTTGVQAQRDMAAAEEAA